MADEKIVEFCQRKHELERAERSSIAQRQEMRNALDSIGSLLLDSMRRSDLKVCGNLRLPRPVVRPRKVENVQDVLRLVHGLSECLDDVSAERLPVEGMKLVRSRLREGGIAHVSRRPVATSSSTATQVDDPETTRLAREYHQLMQNYRNMCEESRKLRNKVKQAEHDLLENLRDTVTVQVQHGETRHTVSLQRKFRKPPSVFGSRNVLSVVREAFREASTVPRHQIQEYIERRIVELLETPPPSPKVYIRMIRRER